MWVQTRLKKQIGCRAKHISCWDVHEWNRLKWIGSRAADSIQLLHPRGWVWSILNWGLSIFIPMKLNGSKMHLGQSKPPIHLKRFLLVKPEWSSGLLNCHDMWKGFVLLCKYLSYLQCTANIPSPHERQIIVQYIQSLFCPDHQIHWTCMSAVEHKGSSIILSVVGFIRHILWVLLPAV